MPRFLLSFPLENQESGRSNPRTRKLMKYPRRGPPRRFLLPEAKVSGHERDKLRLGYDEYGWQHRAEGSLGPFSRGKKKNRIGGRDGLGLWRRVEFRLA